MKKKHIGYGCLGLVALFLLITVIGAIFAPKDDLKKAYNEGKAKSQEGKGQNPSTDLFDADGDSITVEKPKLESKWSYAEDIDEMNDRKTYFAQVESNDILEFEFPYDGGAISTLTIRKKGSSTDIIYQISKGQIISDDVYGGNMKVKFDDEKPITIKYTLPDDHSSDVLFLGSAALLIKKMKTAKRMLIAVTFYEEGTQNISFPVEGLEWDH